jgi:general stress protein 26
MTDVRQRVLDLLQPGESFLASLATVTEDGRPWVRYVSPRISEDLTLRIATSAQSRKAAHIRKNPEVHLTCGVTDPKTAQYYLQIGGKADVVTDKAERAAFWSDGLKEHFAGPEDPDYAIIIIKPYRIEVYPMMSMDFEVWER